MACPPTLCRLYIEIWFHNCVNLSFLGNKQLITSRYVTWEDETIWRNSDDIFASHKLTLLHRHVRRLVTASFADKYWASMGWGEWKFVQMFQVAWPCPYMVKNFKNLLLRNQEADDLETWYTASGTQVLPMFSYDDPALTLTIFMTGSNLLLNASAWVKAYLALNANVFPSLF